MTASEGILKTSPDVRLAAHTGDANDDPRGESGRGDLLTLGRPRHDGGPTAVRAVGVATGNTATVETVTPGTSGSAGGATGPQTGAVPSLPAGSDPTPAPAATSATPSTGATGATPATDLDRLQQRSTSSTTPADQRAKEGIHQQEKKGLEKLNPF